MFAFIAFAADGKTVALGRSDRTVRFWETDTGRELARFEGEQGSGVSVALAPDGRTVAQGSTAGKILLTDRVTGKELPSTGHQHPIHAVGFAPDGKLLATASADRTIRLWDRATGEELLRLNARLLESIAAAD